MKNIAGSEKLKVQKIINKIESGQFDEIDIDGLLIKLRAYTDPNSMFVELAHFVAHSDQRTQGITFKSLEIFLLSMKYFFHAEGRKINIFAPIPSFMKEYLKVQLRRRFDEVSFKNNYFTKDTFLKLIDTLFVAIEQSEESLIDILTFHNFPIDKRKFIEGTIDYLMKFTDYPPHYTQNEIIDSIIATVKKNKLNFSEKQLRIQEDKIMLCILYLLNNKEFKFNKNEYGRTKIFFEKEIYQNFNDIKNEDVKEVFAKQGDTFGNLVVIGVVKLNWSGHQFDTIYHFLMTNLKANKWCSDTLLQSLDYRPNSKPPIKLIHLDTEIKECIIDENFKLGLP